MGMVRWNWLSECCWVYFVLWVLWYRRWKGMWELDCIQSDREWCKVLNDDDRLQRCWEWVEKGGE